MTPMLLFIEPTAGWPVWLPWLLTPLHSAGQINAITETPPFSLHIFSPAFNFRLPPPTHFFAFHSYLLPLLLLLHPLLLHLSVIPASIPSASPRPEWQLAMGEPVRGWAGRPALPLLSDLAEHAATVRGLGTAPRGQRGQVSSLWLFLLCGINSRIPPYWLRFGK